MSPDTPRTVGAWPSVERWPTRARLTLEVRGDDVDVDWQRLSLLSAVVLHDLDPESAETQRVRHMLTTVLRELADNALWHAADRDAVALLRVARFQSTVCVESQNLATPTEVDALCAALERLDRDDPELLMLARLEHAAAEHPCGSGIGLLKLRADFDIGLGAQIAPAVAKAARGDALVRVRAVLNTTTR
jgi:hypothetical protein